MKKFMAVFLGSSKANAKWKALSEKTRNEREKAGMKAWMEWATKNAKSIVDQGSPLGKTKQVGAKGVSDIKNQMGAYVVVEAKSHADAAKLFLKHPHFMIFPGDSVEVMECMPMPKI